MQSHGGLENYASPHLRAAVFRRLNPTAQITYVVVPISEAFPDGHREYPGAAKEAVRCTISWPDGHYIISHKEIDLKDERRGNAIPQTPENLVKDETKALGRALRDAGIPQRLSELREIMKWVGPQSAPQDILPMPRPEPIDPVGLAASMLDATVEDDPADAGAEDPTPQQVLAERFSAMNGADKAAMSKMAREQFGVVNVLRAGDKAEELLDLLEKRAWLTQATEEEPF